MRPQDDDTICAQITPYGRGGVSVLRISGQNSWERVQKIAPFLPSNLTSRKAYVGFLEYEGKEIDEVLILFFEKNKSFTSEKVVEISCHGNPLICEEILNILQKLGCRMAERGEFTYRAFLSGRVDLPQAESVLNLIESQSQKAKTQALLYLKGGWSQKVQNLKKQILNIQAHTEAEIDFLEEGISVLPPQESLERITQVKKEIQKLIESYEKGVRVRQSLRIGIFGEPNTGKSTLFNQILGEDKAIVSSQEGTTRDQLVGHFFKQGQMFQIVDTAGIRPTEDEIEKEGLKKTLQSFESVDLKIYLLDGTKNFKKQKMYKTHSENFLHLKNRLKQNQSKKNFVFVVNKIDLNPKEKILPFLKKSSYKDFIEKCFFVSARTGEGVSDLKEFFLSQIEGGVEALYSPRHLFHFEQAYKGLQKLENLFKKENIPLELISLELRIIVQNIQSVLGEEVSLDVLNEIFSQFCIGK